MIDGYKSISVFLTIFMGSPQISPDHGTHPPATEIISIERPGNDDPIFLSEFVKEVTILELEASPEGSISRVEDLKIMGDNIFIIDEFRENRISVFDLKTGKFKGAINHQSTTQDDILELTDFSLDERHVYLYDRLSGKVFVYDFEGNLIRKDGGIISEGFNMTVRDSAYYFYLGHPKEDSPFVLNIFDFQHNKLAEYFPKDPISTARASSVMSGTSHDGTIPFYLPLNDTIYAIDGTIVNPKYYVDFGKHRVSEEDRQIMLTDIDGAGNLYIEKDYAIDISNVHFTNELLYFEYIHSYFKQFVFHDRVTKKTLNSRNIVDDLSFLFFGGAATVFNDHLVGVLHPEEFQANVKFIENLPKYNLEITSAGRENLVKLKERPVEMVDDNVILIFYKI